VGVRLSKSPKNGAENDVGGDVSSSIFDVSLRRQAVRLLFETSWSRPHDRKATLIRARANVTHHGALALPPGAVMVKMLSPSRGFKRVAHQRVFGKLCRSNQCPGARRFIDPGQVDRS
jgi:hypothetical protein